MSEIATIRSQSELLSTMRAAMRDTASARWTDAEIYAALNRALSTWGNRVRVPWLYSLSTGWVQDTYDYALPDYMDEFIRPQASLYSSDTTEWRDLRSWTVEADGSGGLVLRLHSSPPSVDGRIIWYMPVGQVPDTLPTLTDGIDADDTSAALTAAGVWPVVRAGWIKIGDEWMQYAGVTRTSATSLTLTNLERGVYGTEVAAHDAGTEVEWGIAADRDDLWEVLNHQVMEHLHALFMTDGSNTETDTHAVMMKYHSDAVQAFWRGYIPSWRPRSVLTREAVGFKVY